MFWDVLFYRYNVRLLFKKYLFLLIFIKLSDRVYCYLLIINYLLIFYLIKNYEIFYCLEVKKVL